MFEIVDSQAQRPVIKVIGVGGAGGNAVDHMIEQGVQGVEFIAVNTDAQALSRNKARNQMQLGTHRPGRGRQARGGARRGARRPRAHRGSGRRRAHGVHHRRHGRRHRHRRGAGGRGGRARAGHPDGGGGHQAVHLRGPKRMQIAEAGHRGAGAARRFADRDPQRQAEEVLGEDVTQEDAFSAADDVLQQRGRRHRRDHQQPRPGQRRLPGRAHGDVGAGHGDDGLGGRRPASTARASPPSRRSPARCWRA